VALTRAAPAGRPSLGERLRALDQREFVDFCAGLWTARGSEVRRAGERLVVSRSDGHLVVLPRADPGRLGAARAALQSRLSPDDPTDGTDVDLVVTPVDAPWATRLARRHDARLVGPAELTRLLLYGVPRAAADELTSQHLGLSVTALTSDTTRSPATERSRRSTLLVVAGAACLVLAAVVAGVWAPGPTTSTPSGSGGGAVAPGDASTPRSSVAGTVTNEEPTDVRTASMRNRYPPGVERDSLDVTRLADTHATYVSGRSYRLIVRQSGTEALDGSGRWDGAWQHAVVDGPRTWLFVVIGYDTDGTESRLVQYTAYADGEFVYRRTDSNEAARYDRYPVEATDREGFDAQAGRAHRALTRYLSTTDVTVDRPSWRPDLFRVVATGQPTAVDGPVSNYTATALVSEAGFVSELTVTYTRHAGEEPESVRFRFEYAGVDETNLTPPGWYDEARAETAANVTDD
jgi:hypothetical protein